MSFGRARTPVFLGGIGEASILHLYLPGLIEPFVEKQAAHPE
jgi:hypothetical protein